MTPWPSTFSAGLQDEIAERYLPALIEIVARQIDQPSAELAAVYRDELCRYELQLRPAPGRGGAAERRATAAALIAAQRTAFERAVAAPESALVVSLLDQLNGPLLAQPSTRVNMLLLGDCLMNEIRCFLADKARQSGVAINGYHLYFSGALSVPFDMASIRHIAEQHRIDFIGLSPFTFDGLPIFRELLARAGGGRADRKQVDSALAVVTAIVDDIQQLIDAPILLHGACGAPIGRDRGRLTSLPPLTQRGRELIDLLNAGLARRAASWSRVIFVDEGSVARRTGLRYLSGPAIPGGSFPVALFHTSRLGRELAGFYWELVDSHCQLGHIRALAVDLDGTLWSGVMAEGKVSHFAGRQVLLRRLARQGIVLMALSKGTPASLRWNELRISPRDFALIHRNWGVKTDGLRLMLQELNIRPEHVGVIDDNPTERALLASAFPDVTLLDPDEPRTWRRLALLQAAGRGEVTDEARNRAGRYRANQVRRRFVAGTSAADAKMRELGLTLTFGRMTATDVPRTLELLRRTNQFNTTGFAPAKSRLLQMTGAESDHEAFVAHLRDRFGDFGLVAVTIVRRRDPSIESFTMSCRAMGYGVERVVLDRVIGHCGVPLSARLVRTRLNEPCHGLYASAGFTEQEPGIWRLDIRQDAGLPAWFDIRDALYPAVTRWAVVT